MNYNEGLSDEEAKRLRRSPRHLSDPRMTLNPFWALIRRGFPGAVAKRAMRGELIEVEKLKSLTPDQINEEYGLGDMDELILLEPYEIKRATIVVRPEFLSQETVDSAPCLGYEYLIKDGTVPGLSLRVRASGHKSYVLHFRMPTHNGSRKLKIATAGAITLEAARARAKDLWQYVINGKDPRLCIKPHNTP